MKSVRPAAVRSAVGAAVLLAAALASDASAQQPPGARVQQEPPPASRPARAGTNEADANADLSITARVTADSLRFEKVPNTRVEFPGRPERATVWEAERENLPPQVQPGVTYRDIGITLRITSVFADIDRIVAEALGEVPAEDDARPAPTPPPGTNTPPAESNTPPAQTPARDAAAARTRRGPARRGRLN
jgi:uncharacterized protein (DUF58 family)